MKIRHYLLPDTPIHSSNGIAFSVEDKANAVAEHLKGTFTPTYNDADVDWIEELDIDIEDFLITVFTTIFKTTSPETINKVTL